MKKQADLWNDLKRDNSCEVLILGGGVNGTSLMREGKYYRAADTFELAAIVDSQNPIISLARCGALFGAGEFLSGAFYLDKALTSSGEMANIRIAFDQLFRDDALFEKRFEELAYWQEQTQNPMLLLLKGYLQYQAGNVEQARASLNAVLEIRSDSVAARALLAALDQQQQASPEPIIAPGP